MLLKYFELKKLRGDMQRYQKVKDYSGSAKPGHLYRFYPDEAVCSDGSQYHALFRKGTKNKLLIVLDGGGVVFDRTWAAYPSGVAAPAGTPSLYDAYCMPSKAAFARLGLFHEKCKKSPFYGWTLLYVPYASGDFHAGTGDFSYVDGEGRDRIFHAHGNINLHRCIDFIRQFCPDPAQLVVLGCSAGGFGTAFVGNDILNRFPDCKDCACIVDGAAFDCDYKTCAETLWQVPEAIGAAIHSRDIVADGLEYLYRQQKDRVKIGYVVSIKDIVLTMYQNYYDTNREMGCDAQATARMHRIISDTVKRLEKSVPNISYFLYDYDFNDLKGRPAAYNGGTSHCCLWVPEFMRFKREGCTGLAWIENILSGKPSQIGRNLLIEETVSTQ